MDVAAEDATQLRRAGSVRAARENGLDLGGGRAMQDSGLVAGSRERGWREDGGEVDEGARNRGGGDAAVGGGVAGVRRPRPVGDDSRDTTLGGASHLRAWWMSPEQA